MRSFGFYQSKFATDHGIVPSGQYLLFQLIMAFSQVNSSSEKDFIQLLLNC